MKTKIFVFLMIAAFFVNIAFALDTVNFTRKDQQINTDLSVNSDIAVREMYQDPIFAQPGAYVDLYIKVNNGREELIPRMILLPKYPFVLDPTTPNEATLPLGAGEKLTLHYRLNVDKLALPGDYQVEFRIYKDKSYFPYFLNLKIDDVTADFDAIVQDFSGAQMSLGVINTGKNTANSLTVKIPAQDAFTVTGASGQIIGNLVAGDYTIVNFNIAPRVSRNANFTRDRNITSQGQVRTGTEQPSFNFTQAQIPPLRILLEYTDGIGERRNMTKEIPFDTFMQGNLTGRASFGRAAATTSTSLSVWWYVSGIVVIVLIGIYIYTKYRKKIKNLDGKQPRGSSQKNTPNWVLEEKDERKSRR